MLFDKKFNTFWVFTTFTALFLALLCIGISIYEITRSQKMKKTEKFLWIIAIIGIYTLGELLYIVAGRKNL